jgi:hypothetical protein
VAAVFFGDVFGEREFAGGRGASGDPGADLFGFGLGGEFNRESLGGLFGRHLAGDDAGVEEAFLGLAGHEGRTGLAAFETAGESSEVEATFLLAAAVAGDAAGLEDAADFVFVYGVGGGDSGDGDFVDPGAEGVDFRSAEFVLAGWHLAGDDLVEEEALCGIARNDGRAGGAAGEESRGGAEVQFALGCKGAVAGDAFGAEDGLGGGVKRLSGQQSGEES